MSSECEMALEFGDTSLLDGEVVEEKLEEKDEKPSKKKSTISREEPTPIFLSGYRFDGVGRKYRIVKTMFGVEKKYE